MANGDGAYPSAEILMELARKDTGLADFGAGMFRAGLSRLLDSLERDARLPDEARGEAITLMRHRLGNRLRIEEWYRAHPEVENVAITGPVIVTGLPRTGSTALGNMLSLDPRFRSLRGWEQKDPVPPPVLGEEAADPRRIRLQQQYDTLYRNNPLAASQHIREVDASTEDTEVLGLEFAAQQMTLPVWSYFDWWREADMTDAFAYHRRVVQLLGSRRPPDLWLFKAPHHKFHLDGLMKAYPGARFIMTHRDPAKVVPSYCSLVTNVWPKGTAARHDMAEVGRRIARHLRVGMGRALASRGQIGEDRFIDVHHAELNHDPMGTLQRIYDGLGLELTGTMRAAVSDWLARFRSGSHGQHRYTAEQYGLTDDQLRSDYCFYIDRFDIRGGD